MRIYAVILSILIFIASGMSAEAIELADAFMTSYNSVGIVSATTDGKLSHLSTKEYTGDGHVIVDSKSKSSKIPCRKRKWDV